MNLNVYTRLIINNLCVLRYLAVPQGLAHDTVLRKRDCSSGHWKSRLPTLGVRSFPVTKQKGTLHELVQFNSIITLHNCT